MAGEALVRKDRLYVDIEIQGLRQFFVGRLNIFGKFGTARSKQKNQ
jgi:hypothetical protein